MAPRKALRKKTVFMALAALGFGVPLACKSKRLLETSTTAYIIGPNDIKNLTEETKQKVPPQIIQAEVLLATRLASKKTKFCSGTLVDSETAGAPLRILTNHHCFAETDAEGKSRKVLLREACTETKVYFGFESSVSSVAFESACVPGSLRTDYNGDLAVFQLTTRPPETHQPLKFYAGSDHGIGRLGLIVHHPDIEANAKLPPDGGVRLPTASVTLDDCKVIGLFDPSEWDLDRTLPYSLRHSCDLIHGSSGSALIDVESSTILGVNWGGIKISQGSDTRTENVATRADYAAAFLANDLDSFLKSGPKLRPRSEGLAEAAPEDAADKGKKANKNIVAGLTGRACGTLGLGHEHNSRLGSLALLLALVFPLGLVVRRLVR
jgi:hypothetical protein